MVFATYSLLYIKIECIDWFLYVLTLRYITYSVVIEVIVVSINWNVIVVRGSDSGNRDLCGRAGL